MLNKLQELRATGAEEGFTLIELMIVVVIIGILAAIAIPIFMNQQKGAIAATMKSDVKNTVTALNTALVKNPTATDVSALITPKTSDAATEMTVAGSWDSYIVRAVNPNADSPCWEYSSITGKGRDCDTAAEGAIGGGDSFTFDENAIVYSTSVVGESAYIPNNGGVGICTGGFSLAFDEQGIARATQTGDIRFCDLNDNNRTTAPYDGFVAIRVAWAGAGNGSHFIEFPVTNGKILGNSTVPREFVEIAKEGATAQHSALYQQGTRFAGSGFTVFGGGYAG